MKPVCILYLVRHGQSEANRDNIVGGHQDAALTEKGKQQARKTKEILSNVHFDAAYSSDLQRASATGAIVYGTDIPKDRQLFDLRERSFGKLEGQSADIWHKLNEVYDEKYSSLPFEERWEHPFADYTETDKALYTRFEAALKAIARKHQSQTVLVATHGGDIRTTLMKLGYAPLLTAGAFTNAGYVELSSDGESFKIEKVVGVNNSGVAAE